VATRLDRQWRFRRRGKLLPACTPLPRPNHTPTTLTLRGAFSSPRDKQINVNGQRQFYSWQPRHSRYRHRPLLPPAPPPPQPSNPQHHMSSGTNAGTTHQPHYHYHLKSLGLYLFTITIYSSTSRLSCTNRSSLYCPLRPALPALLQYYCTSIAQYTTPPRPPFCMPYTIIQLHHLRRLGR